ncbi:hypothetical protein [Lactobacillus kitasatonis]|uniref:Uncharacterized protein n=1 Tax=Lactobacillus kitasatonis DSM 16761 = JCM 1039 TaxID=1423767 RepID=A0A0R1VMZ4_9LACO|nr:hypothetical protein [Lactobacillus kitasatonis]KRM03084.1 hypothetical protein FC59_GL001469 [Lactobacillus kitasatonis DSM 16761 = JCM 1039]
MAIILLILIAIIIWLLIKIYDYKKINTKLSKQNNELTERIKLLTGTSQLHSENSDEKSSQGSEDNEYASIPPTPFNEKNAAAWKKYEDEQSEVWTKYRKVQESQPDYDKQFGRSFDYPKYTDKYDTNTDFSLRELLLLIWWGKIKKGRLTTAKIPKYFIFTYNLNAQKVTQKFLDKGWLFQEDNRYFLSKEAKQATEFYSDLWEMHQADNFPICLDEDFPNWNHGKLLITFYKNDIDFQNKLIAYYNKLNSFYKSNPKFFADKQMQDNHIQEIEQSISEAQNVINKNNKIIKAIE